MTYGDGISDINIKKLLNFHLKNKSIATLTAVRPPVRFGEIKFRAKKSKVLLKNHNLEVVGLMEVFLFWIEIYSILLKIKI